MRIRRKRIPGCFLQLSGVRILPSGKHTLSLDHSFFSQRGGFLWGSSRATDTGDGGRDSLSFERRHVLALFFLQFLKARFCFVSLAGVATGLLYLAANTGSLILILVATEMQGFVS